MSVRWTPCRGILAALCLLVSPVVGAAKPPDLPRGPGRLCQARLSMACTEPFPGEQRPEVLPEPDANGLLLAPIGEGKSLVVEVRLDPEGKRFLRLALVQPSPPAMPAILLRPEKAQPLPPLTPAPGWPFSY
jgi:hypothetical protein